MMMLEAKSRFRVDVPIANRPMFGLWPQPDSISAALLDPIAQTTTDTLSLLLLTTLTRYAIFRALQIDGTETIMKQTEAILRQSTDSVNTRVHKLFGVLYENLRGYPFDFDEGGVNMNSTMLDIAESEAFAMSGQILSRTQQYHSDQFLDITRIDKATTPPADTIVIGMLMNFAIDLAVIEAQDTLAINEPSISHDMNIIRNSAMHLLEPVFIVQEGDTSESKTRALLDFVTMRIP